MRRFIPIVALMLLAGACSGQHVDSADVPELPAVTSQELEQTLADSTQPTVVNVWASWCIPCRSEAPLLEEAASSATDVHFIGLNVQDDQDGARGFIAQFFSKAPIDYLFDRAGDVPVELGGTRGVPMTFFYAPGGELVNLHAGVIDERTLALQIDEIRSR
jgi:cytochrome c biogenesis protein CcmG, thiol:disulfide interchange protein DsbE